MLELSKTYNNQKISHGFTLIELIVVIIILGVMSVGIGGFITLSTQTYINVTERDELASSARFAIERLNRELRNAVPNSIRIAVDDVLNPTKQCIEFVPIKASTIYTELPVPPEEAANTMKVIPFSNDDGTDYTCNDCGDKIVVYPLSPTDVYQRLDTSLSKSFIIKNYAEPTGSEVMGTLTFEFGNINFSEHSPTNRAFIFNEPVSYCVESNVINRYSGYSFNDIQVLPLDANILNGKKSLMAKDVVFNETKLPFIIESPSLQRNAVVQIKLNFTRDNEAVVFDTSIHTTNIP
jgi:MSHA biogenesis protein MshO